MQTTDSPPKRKSCYVKMPSVRTRLSHQITQRMFEAWLSCFKDNEQMEKHVSDIYNQLKPGGRVRIRECQMTIDPLVCFPPPAFGIVHEVLSMTASRVNKAEYKAGCGQIVVQYDLDDCKLSTTHGGDIAFLSSVSLDARDALLRRCNDAVHALHGRAFLDDSQIVIVSKDDAAWARRSGDQAPRIWCAVRT